MTRRFALALAWFLASCAVGVGPTMGAPDPALACAREDAWACAQAGVAAEERLDYVAAEALYVRACDLGSGWGCHELGELYARSSLPRAAAFESNPFPVVRPASLALFELACQRGYEEGCYEVARIFGGTVERDDARLTALYVRACDAGSLRACGVLLDRATGDDPVAGAPPVSARRLCDRGSALACVHLLRQGDADRLDGPGLEEVASTVLAGCVDFESCRPIVVELGAAWESRRAATSGSSIAWPPGALGDALTFVATCLAPARGEDTRLACYDLARQTLDAAEIPPVANALSQVAYAACPDEAPGAPTACALAGALDLRELRGATRMGRGLERLGRACADDPLACLVLSDVYRDGRYARPSPALAARNLLRACVAGYDASCARVQAAARESWFPESMRPLADAAACTAVVDLGSCVRACVAGVDASCDQAASSYRIGDPTEFMTDEFLARTRERCRRSGGARPSCVFPYAAELAATPVDVDRLVEFAGRSCTTRYFPTAETGMCPHFLTQLRGAGSTYREPAFEVAARLCARSGECDAMDELGVEACAGEASARSCGEYFGRLGDRLPRDEAARSLARSCDAGAFDACDFLLGLFSDQVPPREFVPAVIRAYEQFLIEFDHTCEDMADFVTLLERPENRRAGARRIAELRARMAENCE